MTIIDCHSCPVRGRHCGQCIVPVVARQWLDMPVVHVAELDDAELDDIKLDDAELDDAEWEAVDVFERAGLLNTLAAAGARASVEPVRVWSRVG